MKRLTEAADACPYCNHPAIGLESKRWDEKQNRVSHILSCANCKKSWHEIGKIGIGLDGLDAEARIAMPMSNGAYIATGGTCCPYCRSTDKELQDDQICPEVGGWVEWSCNQCGEDWTELVGLTIKGWSHKAGYNFG